jgi:hypothetical protein
MTGAGGTTTNVSVPDAVVLEPTALITGENVPKVVGVPEINPLDVDADKPGGKLLAT